MISIASPRLAGATASCLASRSPLSGNGSRIFSLRHGVVELATKLRLVASVKWFAGYGCALTVPGISHPRIDHPVFPDSNMTRTITTETDSIVVLIASHAMVEPPIQRGLLSADR